MYNLKNKSSLIVLVGIVSYLYLFSSLLNKNYDIIFIYFTVLFAGYFIIGNKIFLFNLLIIIFDILNKKFIIREGNNTNKRFKKAQESAKKNKKFQKGGASIKIKGIGKNDSKELEEKMDERDKENQKKNKNLNFEDSKKKKTRSNFKKLRSNFKKLLSKNLRKE